MPVNDKYLAKFESGCIYHVYNKTNNKELLFRSDQNYHYFLTLFNRFISPLADTYAWTFLPNHFHFLIRIKQEKDIHDYIIDLPSENQTRSEKRYLIDQDLNKLMEMEFKRFFTSYAMSFNSMYNRTGNLFYRALKRVIVSKDYQFTQALVYIHANAQKHRLVKRFDHYKWTSYNSLVSQNPTSLLRNEIFEWFGGLDSFIKIQNELTDFFYSAKGFLENDE